MFGQETLPLTTNLSTTTLLRDIVAYLVIISYNRQCKSSTNVSYCQAVLILERSCGSIKPWKTSASKHSWCQETGVNYWQLSIPSVSLCQSTDLWVVEYDSTASAYSFWENKSHRTAGRKLAGKEHQYRLIPLWLVPRETKRLRQQNGCLLELRPGSVLFCLKHNDCGQKF